LSTMIYRDLDGKGRSRGITFPRSGPRKVLVAVKIFWGIALGLKALYKVRVFGRVAHGIDPALKSGLPDRGERPVAWGAIGNTNMKKTITKGLLGTLSVVLLAA